MKFIIKIGIIVIIAAASFGAIWQVDAASVDGTYTIYNQNRIIPMMKAKVQNNTAYLPCDMIGKYINNLGITVDTTAEVLIIDMTKQNIMMANSDVTAFVKANASKITIPLKSIENQYYFPINVVETFFKVKHTVTSKGVYLSKNDEKAQIARINTTSAPVKASLMNEDLSISKLNLNDEVQILKETDNYYKVETNNGAIVYVKKSYVTISEVDLGTIDFYSTKKQKWNPENQKINLVWEYVNKVTPAAPSERHNGIDVVCPTWYYLTNTNGDVGNKADKGYADAAHELGYIVWGIVTNGMNGDNSNAIFYNQQLMDKAVAQYILYACLYDLDGINIDFESVYNTDGDGLTAFTALMRKYTEKQGLNLSIDVMVPRSWNAEYDNDKLAKYVDYIAVMTYDEHWSSSPEAGSISSVPYAEDGVKRLIEEGVPADKLLMGIPTYTRIWTQAIDTGKLSSKAIGMAAARTIVNEKTLTPTWLDTEKQYYVEYTEADGAKKIWLEDSRSIAYKLDIIQRYNIAGSCVWRMDFAEKKVWTVFDGMLKNGLNFKNFDNYY